MTAPAIGRTGRMLHRITGRSASFTVLVVLAVLLVLANTGLGRYDRDVLTSVLLYVAGASAWNLVGGMAGQFSLAHSAFVGAGSYTAVLLMRNLDVPAALAVLIAAVGGGLIAAIAGSLLFRLQGPYFTVASLAFSLAALTWMTTWDFTGATTGVSAPIDAVPDPEQVYLFGVVIAVAAILAAVLVKYSAFGLRVLSVRDDEEVASSLGVSPMAHKLAVMAVSGVLTGAAGAVLALQRITVEPFSSFSINWVMTFAVMAIIGGLGTVWGPVIGAALIYYGLTVQLQSLPTVSTLVSGVLLVLITKFVPGGILGLIQRGIAAGGRRRRSLSALGEPPG